jgi:2-keto-4-pentenoate hydratase/2-oxohepta-3-ene-1,7-dioic acid hydratase in catechol pathway
MKIGRKQGSPFLILDADHGRPILNCNSVVAAALMSEPELKLGPIETFQMATLQQPIKQPHQILAVGMNYLDHSKEIHLALPQTPSTFTKFSSSLTGPTTTIRRHGSRTDWETELVVVVGKAGRNISTADAANHIAGYMVGEDLSDRDVQFANSPAQFSLGKSFEHYSPIGPYLTTPDEIDDLGYQEIRTLVNDREVQRAQLKQMIFDPAALIHYFSSIIELQAGDLIFTGTPSGTGVGHEPEQYLKKGDHLRAEITNLGRLDIDVIA